MYDPAFEHDACGIGFIVDVDGRRSHTTVRDGIQILVNLTHRGAAGADPECGDGAGILMQVPDAFLRQRCSDIGINLPELGQYGVGSVFLPHGPAGGECIERFNEAIEAEGCAVLGWRNVPVDASAPGGLARETCPDVKQVFVGQTRLSQMEFERKLFLIRRRAEKAVAGSGIQGREHFYVSSLSTRTLCYKGMLMAHQVEKFFPDLNEEDMQTAIAVVHQRYSTNTFPSWSLAQPFRLLCHNGEINTLRGNLNKMTARTSTLASPMWGGAMRQALPAILDENGSDSACLDNLMELLSLSGRSMAHSILMMIPEAWGQKYHMGHDRRGFYEFHANFMEPWDGPAAIAFTDGTQVGGILDRNGLRPARYTLTKDNRMVLASEAGVLDIPASDVAARGRLQPGKMLLVDTERKHILYNDEIKAEICRSRPYRRWVEANRIELNTVGAVCEQEISYKGLIRRQKTFGYTREDLDTIIRPMASDGSEPIGSMGNDTPLAVLSNEPQSLFKYFKQRFAQVTNPPIDPIRESLVMSLTSFIGPEGNILDESPEHARRLKIFTPILTNHDLARVRSMKLEEFSVSTLDMVFEADGGAEAMEAKISELCERAEREVRDGTAILILSDRKTSGALAPIPSLLAASAIGMHLVRKGVRTRIGLILETGEPREVTQFALLFAYGVDAVNPYVALETVTKMHSDGEFPPSQSLQESIENYIHAIDKGLLKILSKMGISSLRSYRGAQIFEAIGLGRAFVDKHFTGTTSRIGGIGIREVAREALMRHEAAFRKSRGVEEGLPTGGEYSYRRDGEKHLWSPEAIHWLQQAVRNEDESLYRKFAHNINEQERRYTTLRSLLDFEAGPGPVPIDEVEPVAEIVKRFVTGAMSFGSLGREAHETMALAMNRIGAVSNSGEGGEDPARYVAEANGDSRSSAVKQAASGRFGVTAEYLANARELQIKIAQGAKPGEGGHLPGHKVNAEIARVRSSTPGVSLISPPPHHDIYSIEDLAQLIFDLKNANPQARISVKLVAETGVGTIAAGVAKGKADMVLISGGDGGTGASPLSSIKHAGLPWELGLSETHQTLVLNKLRDRIRVQTDGQMRTGRDVAIAAMLGAEEFGFGTGALVSLGCVLMRKCHQNSCPVGVATQDPRLRKRFMGKPEHLINYMRFVAQELREIMASLGLRKVEELVGRADLLRMRDGIEHWKARTLDMRGVMHVPEVDDDVATRCVTCQVHDLSDELNTAMVEDAKPAIESGTKVEKEYAIRNTDRTVGARLSFAVARAKGSAGLAEDTISYTFRGSAGQSFGAFASRGMTFRLEGEANDYLGKGLSGGKIIVTPAEGTTYDAGENTIVGNTLMYGATGGEAYINGLAGERFCVRNSGVCAVVEGVGDHGCEYMTGGVAAVLGPTGINFAAGMSGGIAYVYDPQQDFDLRCNLDMVDLEPVIESEDVMRLKGMIERHVTYTGSWRGKWMLDNWDETRILFVKVMPIEYRRALGLMLRVERNARRTRAEVVRQA
jgi:glutamate synthase domain-containing protein 2/glutamate synthase domain-containing protein 1/glutamate synthase domain-containing protein 3